MHSNPTQTTSNTEITAENNAQFPLIAANDYDMDMEFSGMYQYLLHGTLSGNVKKDKPILIIEDKYIIDEDDLLYRVDIPRQKNLAKLKPTTKKRLCVPLKFRHDMISYVHGNESGCYYIFLECYFHFFFFHGDFSFLYGCSKTKIMWLVVKIDEDVFSVLYH